MPDSALFSSLTVLSLEQATTLPFLTYRLAQDGMRVIRVENPASGDPNRKVGAPVPEEPEMGRYFLPNNCGKRAITLNLSTESGRDLLLELVRSLPVDIFCTNQMPRQYTKLGIDEPRLRAVRPDLIWVGISGFGPEHSEPAYDPILQARAGWMDLTGDPNGPPTVFGIPMVDLGAAEHAYGQVQKALYRRAKTGEGTRIDLSMFQCAVSWLVNPVMMAVDFGEPIGRRGNTHPYFAPVSVYPTSDGHVYLAVGNDRQWEALSKAPGFERLAQPEYAANAGRIAGVARLNAAISEITRGRTTAEMERFGREIGVPVAAVRGARSVAADPLIGPSLLHATHPESGRRLTLPPPPVMTEYLESTGRTLSFPPRLGEHNAEVYGAIGCTPERLETLRGEGVV